MPDTDNKPQEKLTDADKHALELSKMKIQVAQSNLKAVAAQVDAVELAHSNLVLRLAFQYDLKEGDQLEDNGSILRVSKQQKVGE